MGASRSASVALAALLAGCVGYAAHAETSRDATAVPSDRTEAGVRSAAVDAAVAGTSLADGATAPAQTGTLSRPAADKAVDAPENLQASKAPDATKDLNESKANAAPKAVETAQPVDPAAAPAPGVPVAAVPAPADPLSAAVAARLSDSAPLLPRLTTKDREAMQAFYGLGAFKPVWIADGVFTPAAKAAAARLARAGEDGLNVQAYPVPVIGTQGLTEAQTAEIELKLSAAVVLYAKDARGGRINLTTLSRLITPVLDIPAADTVLGRIAAAGPEAGALLQRYNPAQPGYLALKARLASLREHSSVVAPAVSIPAGPVLKVGMRDTRVPAIRAHFGLPARLAGTLDAGPGEPEAYDSGVASAVAEFQRSRGLPATGVLTQQTVIALSRPDSVGRGEEGEAALLVNMERWRWLPSDLGPDYVMVNIPEFRLRVVKNGTERDENRVIVGKTETPTPIFSGLIEYAVVNPSWNVPPSILKNEFLPGLARDPNYAARRGYEVIYRNGNVSVRQPPGERNALGFIKFLFPNNHAVYLHDTPNRSLFSSAHRAMSHGCVRVDDPFRFADSVLPEAWSSERLKKLIGKGERTIRLTEKLPVHLAYFTSYVDDAGGYRTLPDLYGYDARMKIALGLAPGSLLVAKSPAKAPAEVRRNSVRTVRSGPDLGPRPVRAARMAPARPATEFGEPDLWTPPPARQSRGWW